MARRSKSEDGVLLAAQLVGLLFLFGMFVPPVRAALQGLTVVLVGLVVIAVVGVIGLVIYRLVRGPRNAAKAQTVLMTPAIRPIDSAANSPGKSSPPELIEQLRSIDWFQFEKLMAALYRKQGFVVTRRGGANADGGIDLIIEKNGARSAVQCKQWKTWNVGVKAVREFIGALTDAGIGRGIFITLRGYTGEARQLSQKHGIAILNETALTKLIDATDARFDPEILDILNDRRKFCPKCESEMVLRTAHRGVNAGSEFWGCSRFPRCTYTLPVLKG